MRIHCARWVCLDVENNLHRVKEEICRAAMNGAEIVVLPELFLSGYSRQVATETAVDVFAAASRSFPELLCVFGTISDGRSNRLTAWTGGERVAVYDKVHLFFPNNEGERWDVGSSYSVLKWRDLTIGFMTCNDVRYPGQARALALDAGCNLLIVPAWWPWRRDHIWKTLLRARAIENGVWVAGCCIAASTFPGEDFSGAGNYVFDPLGEQVFTMDDHTYRIDVEHGPSLIVDPREHRPKIEKIEVMTSEQ